MGIFFLLFFILAVLHKYHHVPVISACCFEFLSISDAHQHLSHLFACLFDGYCSVCSGPINIQTNVISVWVSLFVVAWVSELCAYAIVAVITVYCSRLFFLYTAVPSLLEPMWCDVSLCLSIRDPIPSKSLGINCVFFPSKTMHRVLWGAFNCSPYIEKQLYWPIPIRMNNDGDGNKTRTQLVKRTQVVTTPYKVIASAFETFDGNALLCLG